jgi:hypothetical protein
MGGNVATLKPKWLVPVVCMVEQALNGHLRVIPGTIDWLS